MTGYLTSFDVYFFVQGTGSTPVTMEVFDENHVLIGTSAPVAQLNDVWQNIAVPNIEFPGTFFGMAHQIYTSVRPHFLGCDLNGPNAYLDYGMRFDGTTWMTIGAYLGQPGVFLCRANGMYYAKDGKLVPFTITPGQDPVTDYRKPETTPLDAIESSGDSHSHPGIGFIFPDAVDSSTLQGYNIYRSDDEMVTYNQINTSLVLDTTYVDMDVAYGAHYYFVMAAFAECDSDSSNVVMADVVTGVNPLHGGNILIYPNPATDNIFVKSDYTIMNIEMLNYIGQSVYSRRDVNEKAMKVNVSNLTAGVYFVKVTTAEGIRTVKITVSR
jgi:hypothetical protein